MGTKAIHFIDYEKISDTIMFMDKDVTLNFNVYLAYKQPDGNRSQFHKEYSYMSSKYLNKSNLISIKRNFMYNMTIDIKGDFNNNIMISQSNMIALQMKLKIVYSWFSTLFKYQDDKLILSGTWNENVLYLNRNSTIKFEPIVLSYDNGTYKEGVRLYLNNEITYIDLDIDKFMEFYYIINNMNMYQSAITLLNYISPPTYGNNLSVLGENILSSLDNGRNGNSFFNKITNK